MRIVQKFRASDGSEWDDPIKAAKRETLDLAVRDIEGTLNPPPRPGTRHEVDAAAWTKAKTAVVELCRQEFPCESAFKANAASIHPFSFAGRMLSDVGGPLYRIWCRFMCVGGDHYEYDQPFFANHPEKFVSREDSPTP